MPRRSRGWACGSWSAPSTWDNPLYVRTLASCGDVAEAVEFLGRFDVRGLRRHHIMLVDGTGSSAVVEATPEGQVVIRKQGRYPTVFSSILDLSELRLHPCRRADFEKSAVIDLRPELERGESRHPLSSFF